MLKQLYDLTTFWTWFDHQVLSKDYIELFMWSILFINIFHNTNTIPCSQCSPFQDVTPSLKCSSSIEPPTILPSLSMWNPQLSSVLNSCHKSAAWSQEASRRCRCNDIREAASTIRRPPPVPSTIPQCPVPSTFLAPTWGNTGHTPSRHHLGSSHQNSLQSWAKTLKKQISSWGIVWHLPIKPCLSLLPECLNDARQLKTIANPLT